MSRTIVEIRHHIRSAESLKSVVKTMKTLALVSLGPFERALATLEEYENTVDTGFRAALETAGTAVPEELCRELPGPAGAIVFGSDHGMAADFNERLARFTEARLRNLPGGACIWPVGELVAGRLEDCGIRLEPPLRAPESVDAIPGLLSCLLHDIDGRRRRGEITRLLVFYQTPLWGIGCEPAWDALLPLDPSRLADVRGRKWPSRRIPEPLQALSPILEALLREHLFACLFRACVRSGTAEHSVRLAAMQRAERNIGDLLEALGREYHEQRQAAISEELFDVLAGFEALGPRRL
ncbi:MAG TPA: F0F1 ATP synthase subunit gamma [Candidatus Ozemobacteraceae bacterium]